MSGLPRDVAAALRLLGCANADRYLPPGWVQFGVDEARPRVVRPGWLVAESGGEGPRAVGRAVAPARWAVRGVVRTGGMRGCILRHCVRRSGGLNELGNARDLDRVSE